MKDDVLQCPFSIVVDSREKQPWAFSNFRGDAKDGYRPLEIRTLTSELKTGDYAIWQMTDKATVERKSLADLFGTVTRGRGRFERELERLVEYPHSAVVCEADWRQILTAPPQWTQTNPKTVFRSVLNWTIQFPTIAWFFLPSRRLAEVTCFRWLQRIHANEHGRR